MKCKATGFPEPYIIWVKENTMQTREGENFYLEPALAEDSGKWTCTARNFMGTDSASTNLIIASKELLTG